jgi:ABC-type lipoprotein export system ATPase subunit
VKTSIAKAEVKTWRDSYKDEPLADSFSTIDSIDVGALRKSCGESELKRIEASISPIVSAATDAAATAPADVQQLASDQKLAEVAHAIIEAKGKATFISEIAIIKSFVNALEEGTRKEIAEQSESVIKAITGDIQQMWEIVHPGEHIENVRLHVPEDAEKAIDVCLKFHGIDQDSPRLTLSEGFRNSLGLCIFLAMAKRESKSDRPIFLDDVVVSVDRNHRGMVVELIEKVFNDRQLIVLTHDRDWFIELKQRLQGDKWTFKALMPYDSPKTGIRWSARTFGFDDARKLLDSDPAQAGNTARKIMDIELATRAEKLGTRLPYLHRERNDHRVAHEFLSQIISDAERCFERKVIPQEKTDLEYVKYSQGVAALRDADKLLVSWANKASHSFDTTKSESEQLIESCETALSAMDCPKCSKSVFKFEDSQAKILQCGCGEIRWRYGKN